MNANRIVRLTSFVVFFVILLGCTFKGMAQTRYVTLINTNASLNVNYPVQTNDLVSLIGSSGSGFHAYGYTSQSSFPASFTANTGQVLSGLTNLSLTANGQLMLATFQITTPTTDNVVSNSYIPANAVVIPASATGNVQIILESSIDLVNWTAADPGIYGASSATNRFFRVRAVHN